MGVLERVELQMDEFEALRLCDGMGLDQEDAGLQMGVSRGTVQRLLASARRKVADALSGGKALVVKHPEHVCFRRGQGRHRRGTGANG